MSHARRRFVATGVALLTGIAGITLVPPPAQGAAAPAVVTRKKVVRYNVKTPTSRGFGGAVTSVDPEASGSASKSCAVGATRWTPRSPRPLHSA